ncbi:zinc finger protein 692 [Phyllostomus discolor]|uniref:Zinc finger protein 692 n=1 Tax=Phyllostomus discolor TaxID=89673 RepID=A0A834DW30_9CHIR|nr:zinc finger protein 692 [Phyllostomus discolor]
MAASTADASHRRREKRRQLDARRSKCRIRLGGHMEQWCLLKERLGFSLHSQLAKFLLDRYTSSGCGLCAGLESEHEKRTQEARVLRGMQPPPEFFLPPGEDEGGDADESEEEMLSDASPWTYSSSSDNCEPDGPRLLPSPVTHALKEGEIALDTAAAPTSLARPPSSAPAVSPGASLPVEGGVELELNRTPQVAQQSEPLASPGSQAQSSLVVAWDKDHAQIGPKRIRKAAKKELLPCDFPGCGRIFSNRQYLNHHKKYQHIHQKSFSCPEPACGKSFNFKKHLKEHVKLHSGATAEPEQPVWKGQPEALQGQQRQAADSVHIEEAAVTETLATLIADTERLASMDAWTHLKLCSPGTALATVQVAVAAPNYSGSSCHTHHLCTACPPPPLMQQTCRGLGGQGS